MITSIADYVPHEEVLREFTGVPRLESDEWRQGPLPTKTGPLLKAAISELAWSADVDGEDAHEAVAFEFTCWGKPYTAVVFTRGSDFNKMTLSRVD